MSGNQGQPSLVGARIGNDLKVIARVKPGKRVQYLVRDMTTRRISAMRGYKLVRLIREAVAKGQRVQVPGAPWRNETHGSLPQDPAITNHSVSQPDSPNQGVNQ